MERMRLACPFELKEISPEGTFEGYGSVFGVLDAQADIVAKGAFKRTLAEHAKKGRMPALLWQHDPGEPIGAWRKMTEDDHGLLVHGELFVNDIARAKAAHKLLKENAISGLSIGFNTVKSEIDNETETRTLTEVELWEVSLVTFPALDEARVADVKLRLAAGELPTEREFERLLTRDAGFSRSQARTIIARGFKALVTQDADGGLDELVASIKRAASVLT